MKVSKEAKIEEAVKRMEMLHISKNVIKEFKEDNLLNLSENGGYLYWLNEDEKALVKKFEAKFDGVVYHVIHDFTNFGELYSMLYVSDWKEEWASDRRDLKDGIVCVYAANVTNEFCSDMGSISIRPRIGGLERLY